MSYFTKKQIAHYKKIIEITSFCYMILWERKRKRQWDETKIEEFDVERPW